MQCPQHGGAGTKLQAVMENLQRQQAARLALGEISLTQTDVHSFVESHINRRVRAFHRYQSAMQDVLTAEVTNSLSGVPLSHLKIRSHENADAPGAPSANIGKDDEKMVGLCVPPQSSPMFVVAGVPMCVSPARCADSPPAGATPQHGWTYEEQFKQVRQAHPREGASPHSFSRKDGF